MVGAPRQPALSGRHDADGHRRPVGKLAADRLEIPDQLALL
jgi:hypothetical protein